LRQITAKLFGKDHFLAHAPWSDLITWVKVGAVLAAFLLAHSAKKLGEHNKWVKARFVREVNRSLGASAEVARQTGEAHDAFVPSSIWVLFRYLRRPLHLFHCLQLRSTPGSDLLSTMRAYREKRLKHDPMSDSKPMGQLSQYDYQVRTGKYAKHRHHQIEHAYHVSTAVFFVCGLTLLLVPSLHDHPALYKLAKWLTVFLPVLSASLLVLPNLWDIHRRRRVAPALARTLARLDEEATQVERVLTDLAACKSPRLPDDTPVWAGSLTEQRAHVEAWARARFAAIAREAEHAILTEVIGFKTFVENAEVG
jgi:hypothetical protein